MNGKQKKGRGVPTRGSRSRMMDRQSNYDGAFANHRLLQTMGSLVGFTMQVQTKNKEMYEGVFSSMSSQFEVVLELPHSINGSDTSVVINPEITKKKMIFNRNDIVVLKMTAVDVEFASRDAFAIDSAISSKQNGQLKGRKLEPWENDKDTHETLELEENENGWDATDMFRRNEEIYGVQTTYKPEMVGYTTPLPKRDTKEWKENEVQAEKIAQEIEQSSTTQARAELENGQSEEERFSAVSRSEASTSNKYSMPKRKVYSSGSKVPPRLPQGHPQQGHSSQGGNNTYNRYSNSPPPRGGSSYGAGQATGGQSSYTHRHESVPSRNIPAQPVNENLEMEREMKMEEKSELTEYSSNKQQQNYSEPKEQRRRYHKDDTVVDLKKFGKDFNLAGEHKTTPTQPQKCQPTRQVVPSIPQSEQGATALIQTNIPDNTETVSDPEELTIQPKVVASLEEKVVEDKKTPPIMKANSVLNPDAKPFTPRAAATPPPPPTIQTPQLISSGHPHILGPTGMNYPQNVLSTAYIVPQITNSLNRGIPKRGAMVGHQRPDYSSAMQVANATGTPLMNQGPITNMPVQISQGMLPQSQYPHHVSGYDNDNIVIYNPQVSNAPGYIQPLISDSEQYPLLMRYPSPVPAATMLTTMIPTSSVYPQADMAQGPHIHQPMFVSPSVMHHQAAPLAAHPPQAHTPQGHNTGPLSAHNMQPAQPPTPGPSPSQSGLYGGLGGQAALAGHLPPHVHPTQTPHNSQYGAVATHPQQTLVMLPPHMQTPHMIHTNNPHSGAGQMPSSLPQYSTNSLLHFNQAPPLNYISGAHANQPGLPLVHHNQ